MLKKFLKPTICGDKNLTKHYILWYNTFINEFVHGDFQNRNITVSAH